MKKIAMQDVKSYAKGATTYLKENWSEPQKEGYQVSVKNFVGFSIASMGTESVEKVINYLAFSSTSAVVGLIFGLSLQSTYIISSLGTIISLFFTPIVADIVDNLGVLKPGTFKKINILGIFTLIGCTALYMVETTAFDFIITDLLKHVAIIFGVKYASIYMYLIVYKFFGKKYGKYKPLIMFLGIPTMIFATILVYLPYQDMKPQALLLAVTWISTIMTAFSTPYRTSYEKMQNLLTTNNNERVFIFSVLPILVGILRSCISIFLPIVATLSGFEVNSIGVYRIVIPIFGFFSVGVSFFICWSQENIKFAPKSAEEKIPFKRQFKEVFSNKYLWIVMVSNSFTAVSSFDLILLEWVLIYSAREQWIMGVLIALVALPSTLGNLMTPVLAKKFDNRKLIRFFMFGQVAVVSLSIPFLFSSSTWLILIGLTIIGMLTTITNTPKQILKKTCKAQALDYHQWKFGGKRVDESADLFGYITTVVTLGLGYLSPFLMALVGFVSDRDILYDSSISQPVFILLVVLYVLELLGSAIPYFFFDLDDKNLAIIQRDLNQRKADEEKEMVEAS